MILKQHLHIDNICNISMINAEKTTPIDQERSPRSRFGYLEIPEANTSDLMELFFSHLEAEHGFSRASLRKLLEAKKQEARIPLSIFSIKLSALETIVKYMSENLGMKTSAIARQLNRNVRTIWTTRKNALKKSPERFSALQQERFFIPSAALADRKLSTLEAIVIHLIETYNLSLHEIALLLKRDDSTIWTVQSRAQKKQMQKR